MLLDICKFNNVPPLRLERLSKLLKRHGQNPHELIPRRSQRSHARKQSHSLLHEQLENIPGWKIVLTLMAEKFEQCHELG